MPRLNEKLAASLQALRDLTGQGRRRVLKTSELTRTDRELLLSQGFLKEILNGWVMVTRPSERPGDTTSWYASFWEFCQAYLNDRFGEDWILSPENSIPLHVSNFNVPAQAVVRAPGASNRAISLPHGKSIFAYRTADIPRVRPESDGLRIFPAAEAVCASSPNFWVSNKNDVIAILGSFRGATPILRPLLSGGHTVAAGRIAGAYRLLGRPEIADEIVRTMGRAGHEVREITDPFQAPVPMQLLQNRPSAPVMTRIRLQWQELRGQVIANFPEEPRLINDREGYLASIDERYVSDAYHSLSIEGYHVSEELIERVRNGDWNPDHEGNDRDQRNAMAAKGYWNAFQEVRAGVEDVLNGRDAAELARDGVQSWFQALFEPSVAAGILKPENLAGYRNHFVFIRDSQHVPVAWQAVPDAMDAFFECLSDEEDPRVRAILGHFIFTFIHPLPDGNGRCGRFLMNLMLASGGYPWTIIPVEQRDEYMMALEDASVRGDIGPFTRMVSQCLRMEPPPAHRRTPAEVAAAQSVDANSTPDSLTP